MIKLNIDLIDTRIILNSGSSKHVFFGVDRKFISHALITIMSLIEKSPNLTYQFHVISSDIKENDEIQYIKVLKGSGHGLTIHHAGHNLFESLPTTSLFTRATYYRILAPLLIPDAEQALYLDADMVCVSSPEELWSYHIVADEIANVVAENDNLQAVLAKNAGLKNDHYFNAGMMLINVKQWNNEQISEKAIHLLNTSKKHLQYLDQDALNIILENRVRYIDKRFNYINMLSHDKSGYYKNIPDNICLIHYAGADKPWQEWNQQKSCQYYREIYRHSPMAERTFEIPNNQHQAKKMYKTMFRTHQLLRGVYWWFKYYKMRYL